MSNKNTLRQVYLNKRLTLTDEEYKRRNQSLVSKCIQLIDQRKARSIHIFLPIDSKREIVTWPIIDYYKNDQHIHFIIPKTLSHGRLDHYHFNERCIIENNAWGIPEPVQGDSADPVAVDLIFVPLVIADKKGHRIGYGKGFYDRFLQNNPALKVGLSLQPLLDEIPFVEGNDVPLDVVLIP